MLQFYFLSILLNLTTGLILVYAADYTKGEHAPDQQEKKEDTKDTESSQKMKLTLSGETAFFDNQGFRLILGLLTCFTGIMKLLSVVHNDIPVIGDLVPAIAGLAGGFALLVEYYIDTSTAGVKLSENIKKVFVDGRKYVGIFCIIAGLMHFLFPAVLFL